VGRRRIEASGREGGEELATVHRISVT
jgi:hypothetical protein